jgi:hypothetical protein
MYKPLGSILLVVTRKGVLPRQGLLERAKGIAREPADRFAVKIRQRDLLHRARQVG